MLHIFLLKLLLSSEQKLFTEQQSTSKRLERENIIRALAEEKETKSPGDDDKEQEKEESYKIACNKL